MATENDQYLFLSTAPDEVLYFSTLRRPPTSSGLRAERFIQTFPMEDFETVRLLGGRENARLIELLAFRKSRKLSGPPVFLGSPLICRNVGDPREVLNRIWQATVCRDLYCHWYAVQAGDYTPYALVAAMAESHKHVPEQARRILPYHPAWPALSFPLPQADPDDLCRLLNLIVDPRWFNHPEHPGRLSRLYTYLGITPETLHAVLDGRRLRHTEQLELVMDCCGESGPRSEHPRAFLDRVLRPGSTQVRGLLLKYQRYIRFVREVWMAQRSLDQEVVFDAKMYFNRDDEIAAFRDHCAALAGGVAHVDTVNR